jgi:hypothetical protein
VNFPNDEGFGSAILESFPPNGLDISASEDPFLFTVPFDPKAPIDPLPGVSTFFFLSGGKSPVVLCFLLIADPFVLSDFVFPFPTYAAVFLLFFFVFTLGFSHKNIFICFSSSSFFFFSRSISFYSLSFKIEKCSSI